MFDTIILLTGAIEQPVFSALLLEQNPLLTIISVLTASELCDIDPDVLLRARLIAFTTAVIVPQFILSQLRYGAYNFHPGPPEYPGWAPAHFALYAGATGFGVTAHVMIEKVDAGPIIAVDRFEVPAPGSVVTLEGRAYAHLAHLFWKLSKDLATRTEPFEELPVSWGPRKNTRRGFAALCEVSFDISKEDLMRRLQIFGDNYYEMSPTIRLHGVEFRAVIPAAAPALGEIPQRLLSSAAEAI